MGEIDAVGVQQKCLTVVNNVQIGHHLLHTGQIHVRRGHTHQLAVLVDGGRRGHHGNFREAVVIGRGPHGALVGVDDRGVPILIRIVDAVAQRVVIHILDRAILPHAVGGIILPARPMGVGLEPDAAAEGIVIGGDKVRQNLSIYGLIHRVSDTLGRLQSLHLAVGNFRRPGQRLRHQLILGQCAADVLVDNLQRLGHLPFRIAADDLFCRQMPDGRQQHHSHNHNGNDHQYHRRLDGSDSVTFSLFHL